MIHTNLAGLERANLPPYPCLEPGLPSATEALKQRVYDAVVRTGSLVVVNRTRGESTLECRWILRLQDFLRRHMESLGEVQASEDTEGAEGDDDV